MKTIISKFYNIDENNNLLYLNTATICKLPKEKSIQNDILRREGVILNCPQLKKFNESALVLEPHPDDFVLSVLPYIIKKCNATILNVFTKTTLKYFPWIDKIKLDEKQYEKIRIEESYMVIEKMLNQTFTTLKEKSMRITDKPTDVVETNILNAINIILKDNNSISKIMIPMGVGYHPDHLIIHDAILKNYDRFNNYKMILYPEYPYSRCKRQYNNRLKFIQQNYIIKPILIDVEEHLNDIVDCISAYKSQFNDINRDQMLALVREDCWAISQDFNREKLSYVFYEIVGVK